MKRLNWTSILPTAIVVIALLGLVPTVVGSRTAAIHGTASAPIVLAGFSSSTWREAYISDRSTGSDMTAELSPSGIDRSAYEQRVSRPARGVAASSDATTETAPNTFLGGGCGARIAAVRPWCTGDTEAVN